MIEQIPDEQTLVQRLHQSVLKNDKERLVVIAGHFPLTYDENGAHENIHVWGEFTPYTLELGVGAAQVAKTKGQEVKFLFLADDHQYNEMNTLSKSAVKTKRKNLYQERSGPDAVLHPELSDILAYGGFDETDVLRHDHGRFGREDCLYFSENVLRATDTSADNACAQEYVALVEGKDYINKERDHLLGFIPKRCQGHICDVAMDTLIEGLRATHVFMESTPILSKEELYTGLRGVTLREDYD